jgi:hypothetical protein
MYLWKIGSRLIWQHVVDMTSQSPDRLQSESSETSSAAMSHPQGSENDKMDFEFRKNDDFLRHLVPQIDITNEGKVNLSGNEGRKRRQSFIHKVIKTRIDWIHEKEGGEQESHDPQVPLPRNPPAPSRSEGIPIDPQDSLLSPSSVVNVLNDHIQRKTKAFQRKVDITSHSSSSMLSDIPEKHLQNLVATFTDLIGSVALNKRFLSSLLDPNALSYLFIGSISPVSDISLEVCV